MTKLPQSNIIGAPAEEIRELFGAYLEGDETHVALVLSASPLANEGRDALEKSFESLGYGNAACAFAVTSPANAVQLDPQALFLLVEGLDPICVVCTDADATNLLGQAYRTTYEPDSPARAFGRPAAVFRDFTALLSTENGKQRAWHLLKSLPRR